MNNRVIIESTVIETVHGFQIVRTSEKKCHGWNGEPYGQTIVWYEVVDGDEIIDAFKTIHQARKFCKNVIVR